MAAQSVSYRQSYVEKDRCVRNSTAVLVPGVDVMQGFTMSKTEFEHVFLQTAESMDGPSFTSAPATPPPRPPPLTTGNSRFPRRRRHNNNNNIQNNSNTADRDNAPSATPADPRSDSPAPAARESSPAAPPAAAAPPTTSHAVASAASNTSTPEDAADYADLCRKHAASLQRALPPDYDGAGEFFERAVDTRARFGLFCTPCNADAHVEYAQNLSKRGLTPEAEYHLRCAADIYRILDARSARKYGDVLLYLAVVIDRQGRLQEAENFYRSALAVYRANKLSDDNVRVAIDSLGNNLRAQGRPEEVDALVRRHFLGALD